MIKQIRTEWYYTNDKKHWAQHTFGKNWAGGAF